MSVLNNSEDKRVYKINIDPEAEINVEDYLAKIKERFLSYTWDSEKAKEYLEKTKENNDK